MYCIISIWLVTVDYVVSGFLKYQTISPGKLAQDATDGISKNLEYHEGLSEGVCFEIAVQEKMRCAKMVVISSLKLSCCATQLIMSYLCSQHFDKDNFLKCYM